jgi:hypothetical protein
MFLCFQGIDDSCGEANYDSHVYGCRVDLLPFERGFSVDIRRIGRGKYYGDDTEEDSSTCCGNRIFETIHCSYCHG